MKRIDAVLNDISKLRGDQFKNKDNYNVFDSIGFKNQEVMHSKFIASLLNPKASHGQKDLYLKLFLNIISKTNFLSENVSVKTEKQVGKRRIDIAIENLESAIIIENKIWFQDLERQLEDYYKGCTKRVEKVIVIYLTPYGNLPSDSSLGTLKKEQVICISYEKHIIPWIRECAKISEGRLKTSLEMYIEMVEILINRDGYMSEIFNHLKEDKEKLKLAFKINSALQGRNFIKEFPETIDFLKKRIEETLNESNPHLEDNCDILNLVDEDHELQGWRIYYGDGSIVYATNDADQLINLFDQSDINNDWLTSILFENEEKTDQLLTELFDRIRRGLN